MSRIVLSLALASLVQVSCSSQSSVVEAELLFEGKQMGEYLQRKDSQAFTFVRNGDQRGLVSVDLDSLKLEVLDPKGYSGRDLMWAEPYWIYRLENEVVFWRPGDRKLLATPDIHRLKSVLKNEEGVFELSYIDHLEETRIQCGDQIYNLSGRILHSAWKQDRIWSLAHYQEGLFLIQRDFCSNQIRESKKLAKAVLVKDVSVWSESPELAFTYLNEMTGELFWLVLTDWEQDPVIERVDGQAGESFVGMDLSFFEDQEAPGMIYLDAWALKIRMARKIEGEWKSEQLPILGAVGFYNQALRVNETEVDLVFRAYRAQLRSYASQFERMQRIRIPLKDKALFDFP